MPANERFKTRYVGVYYIKGKRAGGGTEKIYHVTFKKNGKLHEELAGRQYRDDMTPARASRFRAERMEGRRMSRREIRAAKEKQKAETISALWEEFQGAKADNKSLKADQSRWKAHLEKQFGKKRPHDIVTLDVDRLRRKLQKSGLAAATVKQVLVLLKRIINHGVKRGLCPPVDPSRLHFEMPKVNNLKTEDLTPDQLKRLLQIIDEDDHPQAGTMMKLALYTGMRRGEMFKLQWDDIDFDRGFINLVDSKGGPDQKIPLNDAARDLLGNYPRNDGTPYVFPGRGGKMREGIRRPVAAIKKAASLPKDFRPLHGLRHVYASMLASSGKVGMYELQKLLTHKDFRMTQRYSHLRDDALRRASDVASDIIGELDRAANDKGS